uniref:ABC1 atypical kinase-like domain-containing protein n=1 Tax=Octactis speculum TaxID=3111310 RepID=A0A7S2AQ43_9STRA
MWRLSSSMLLLSTMWRPGTVSSFAYQSPVNSWPGTVYGRASQQSTTCRSVSMRSESLSPQDFSPTDLRLSDRLLDSTNTPPGLKVPDFTHLDSLLSPDRIHEAVDTLLANVVVSYAALTTSLGGAIPDIGADEQQLQRLILYGAAAIATTLVIIIPEIVASSDPNANPYLDERSDSSPRAGITPLAETSVVSAYDPIKGASHFAKRRLLVVRRLLKLAQVTGLFNFRLLLDWRFDNLEKNQPQRAKEALDLANMMGPTFIKLGQALSIRTDLIPEAYALELRQLQDRVPEFESGVARQVMMNELGVSDLTTVFSELSEEPVASASIGQVYKGTLRADGRVVAVKVQRPSILSAIALDLYILRILTPFQVWISNVVNKLETDPSDIELALNLVDEWGRGFVAEVDYRAEAQKQIAFSAAMKQRGLGAVMAPPVVEELSSSRLLVTEWIDGTRLDKDASADVPRLCGVAINAYLTMLLDTGTLHCDPHPGNLLRTTDGRLCVLDWGMTLEVPSNLQYGLLDFIAHINSEDYEAIPNDFVNLGFTPPDKVEAVRSTGITEGLSFTLKQLSLGGGPKAIQARVKEEFQSRYGADLSDTELRDRARDEMISRFEDELKAEGVDVTGVTSVMEEMSRRNRELFKLPPYVLYVSRAFSTLEGIGLSIDENYSILQECFPYLARRLLSDDSPRAREALRNMLYGPQETTAPLHMTAGSGTVVSSGGGGGGLLSPEKLIEMSAGFNTFTATTTTADESAGMKEAQDALVDILLNPEGNYIQEVLVEEAARIADALLRDRAAALAEAIPSDATRVLQASRSALEGLPPPLRAVVAPFALPLTLPGDFVNVLTKALGPLATRDPQDAAILDAATVLLGSLESSNEGAAENGALGPLSSDFERLQHQLRDPSQVLDTNSDLWREVFEPARNRGPVVGALLRRVSAAVVARSVTRLEVATEQEVAAGDDVRASLTARDLARRSLEPIAEALRP